MSVPNRDEVEGKLDQAKGSVKGTVGNLIGDKQMEVEGEADKTSGETQETWGKFKHGVSDTVDAIGDALSGNDRNDNRS